MALNWKTCSLHTPGSLIAGLIKQESPADPQKIQCALNDCQENCKSPEVVKKLKAFNSSPNCEKVVTAMAKLSVRPEKNHSHVDPCCCKSLVKPGGDAKAKI